MLSKRVQHINQSDKPVKQLAGDKNIRKDFQRELEIQKIENQTDAETRDEKYYEKKIICNMNDAVLWIEYASFIYKKKGIIGAREVFERALLVINYKNDEEKFKLWTAYLNLEYHFGNETTLMKILERSKNANDARKIYKHIVGLYEQDQKYDIAAEFIKLMVKKFSKKAKSWIYLIQFYVNSHKNGHHEDADFDKIIKENIRKALQSLPKIKHIRFLTQVALIHYGSSEPEHGRTTFENILHDFPKRTDIWSQYIDQEIKNKNYDYARDLLEKCIGLGLKPKKMKFFFKKYLEFEMSHGTEQTQEYVKEKATEYVNNVLEKEKNQ